MPTPTGFEKAQYLNLETYRKNGQAMATPVWFVEKDGALYVKTEPDAGKVKRIRNNARVRIARCDMRGNVTGEWFDATATLIPDGPEIETLLGMWGRKYGPMNAAFDLSNRLRKRGFQLIRVDVAA